LPWPARIALRCARLIERPTSRDSANRLAAALTALGPTYVKLGQFLATRPDVVGVALARDLESLQDRMAPFPQTHAEAALAAPPRGRAGEAAVAAARARPLGDVFPAFGPAVAAASIAQVHRAELRDGRVVAVKVLRPGVEQRFKTDLAAFFAVARMAEDWSAE